MIEMIKSKELFYHIIKVSSTDKARKSIFRYRKIVP